MTRALSHRISKVAPLNHFLVVDAVFKDSLNKISAVELAMLGRVNQARQGSQLITPQQVAWCTNDMMAFGCKSLFCLFATMSAHSALT